MSTTCPQRSFESIMSTFCPHEIAKIVPFTSNNTRKEPTRKRYPSFPLSFLMSPIEGSSPIAEMMRCCVFLSCLRKIQCVFGIDNLKQ